MTLIIRYVSRIVVLRVVNRTSGNVIFIVQLLINIRQRTVSSWNYRPSRKLRIGGWKTKPPMISWWKQWRIEGDFGGSTPLPEIPKLWQSWAEFPVPWKYIRNNLIRIRISLFCKLSRTPDKGATSPHIPFLSTLRPQLNLLNTQTKCLGTPLRGGAVSMHKRQRKQQKLIILLWMWHTQICMPPRFPPDTPGQIASKRDFFRSSCSVPIKLATGGRIVM
jgi:hypothetical protein